MAKTYIIAEQIFFAAFPQRRCTARSSYIINITERHLFQGFQKCTALIYISNGF